MRKKNNFSKRNDFVKKASNKKKQPISSSYPHFRYYKKSGHPALITGEYSYNEYNYRKVTHSERDGRHLNEKVIPNPNHRDERPMYIVKRIRHDKKNTFSNWKYSWKYEKK